MTHERPDLSAWIDGEIDPGTARTIASHVAECATCRREVEQMRALSASLRTLHRHAMPARVRTTLAAAGSRRRASFSPWVAASMASAAVLLVLIAVGVSRIGGPVPQAPGAADDRHASRALESAPAAGSVLSDEEADPAPPDPAEKAASPEVAVLMQAPDRTDPAPKQRAAGARERTLDVDDVPHAPPPPEVPSDAPRDDPAAGASAPADAVGEVLALIYRATVIGRPDGTHAIAVRTFPEENEGEPKRAAALAEPDAGGPTAQTLGREKKEEPDEARVVFLIAIDPQGRILEADPVGARTMPIDRIARVRDLLIGMTLPGPAPGRPLRTSIEVTVPSSIPGL